MKSKYVLFMLLLCGCSTALGQKSSLHCKLIDVLPDERSCTQISGSETHCYIGDVAPDRWGQCVEDTHREFTCLKGDKISHYKNGPNPVWVLSCKECSLLKQQIRILTHIEDEQDIKRDKT